MHGRNLGYRLLIIASLLAYPVTQAATQLVLFKSNFGMPHGELQAVMNLARPGRKSCIAFSSVHPVFCHSVSNLSNGWDLTFAQEINDPKQLARFQQIWSEGISLAIKTRPDIILRRTTKNRWEGALAIGLISQQELDGLDNLLQSYEMRMIGDHEFWLRKSVKQ